ncbi:hypothetical protein CN445_24395 [Bacillus cereus]|nr:hypothetical protein CN445_24395 [Bacillus cereus]
MMLKSSERNFNFFGNVINVESNDSYLLNQLTYIYREYLDYQTTSSDYYIKIDNRSPHNMMVNEMLSDDRLVILHGSDEDSLCKWVDEATFLPPITVPYFRKKYSFFHGCAIRVNNKTVALFGPSRSGKTTLMMKLMEEGYPLISDDLLVIDNNTGEIIPFKKPIGLRNTTKEYHEEKFKKIIDKLPTEIPTFHIENIGLTTELIHINDVPGWRYYENVSKIDSIFFVDKHTEPVDNPYDFFKLISNQACLADNPFNTVLKIFKNLNTTSMRLNIRDPNVGNQILESIGDKSLN